MSEKPDKLIPRLFRFTEDEIRKIGEIRSYYAEGSDAAAVRKAIRVAHWTMTKAKSALREAIRAAHWDTFKGDE
jgi:hypothetical protein